MKQKIKLSILLIFILVSSSFSLGAKQSFLVNQSSDFDQGSLNNLSSSDNQLGLGVMGVGYSSSRLGSQSKDTFRVSVGDVDGEGVVDVVTGNSNEGNFVWLSSKSFYSSGGYSSEVFDGGDVFWGNVTVDSVLNGGSVDVTVESSDQSDFSSIKSSQSFGLSGGVENLSFDEGGRYARFNVSMSSGSSSPKLDFVELNAEDFAVNVDWSSYSSSTNVNGFRIYYGVGSVSESNSVEVESSVDTRQISENSWSTGDNICAEVRPYNINGEASSTEQCVTLN